MQFRIFFYLLGALFLLASCQQDPQLTEPGLVNEECGIINVANAFSTDIASDEFGIEDARIDGDCLYFDVAYSGGCATHEFYLVWTKTDFEADPIEVDVELRHDSGGESCEAFLRNTVSFDTELLQHAEANSILINIKGVDKSYQYNY